MENEGKFYLEFKTASPQGVTPVEGVIGLCECGGYRKFFPQAQLNKAENDANVHTSQHELIQGVNKDIVFYPCTSLTYFKLDPISIDDPGTGNLFKKVTLDSRPPEAHFELVENI